MIGGQLKSASRDMTGSSMSCECLVNEKSTFEKKRGFFDDSFRDIAIDVMISVSLV